MNNDLTDVENIVEEIEKLIVEATEREYQVLIEMIAKQLGLTPKRIKALFTFYTGQRLNQYVRLRKYSILMSRIPKSKFNKLGTRQTYHSINEFKRKVLGEYEKLGKKLGEELQAPYKIRTAYIKEKEKEWRSMRANCENYMIDGRKRLFRIQNADDTEVIDINNRLFEYRGVPFTISIIVYEDLSKEKMKLKKSKVIHNLYEWTQGQEVQVDPKRFGVELDYFGNGEGCSKLIDHYVIHDGKLQQVEYANRFLTFMKDGTYIDLDEIYKKKEACL